MKHLRSLAALALCALSAITAQAQTTVKISFPVYDNYIISTGDNVNLRQKPSMQSGRLMVGYDNEEYGMGRLFFSDAANKPRYYNEPVQANREQVMPYLDHVSGWYKTLAIYDLSIQKEVYISDRFAYLVSDLARLTKDDAKKTIEIFDFPTSDWISRPTGKYKNLSFCVAVRRFEGIADALILLPYALDDHFMLCLTGCVELGKANSKTSGTFEWSREKSLFTGEIEEVTRLNIGEFETYETPHEELLARAVNALLTCSDEEFDRYATKELAAKLKSDDYNVIFRFEAQENEYNECINYPDPIDCRRITKTIDLTNNQ